MNTSHLVGSVYLVGSYILNFIMKFMICLPTCSLHFTLSLIIYTLTILPGIFGLCHVPTVTVLDLEP